MTRAEIRERAGLPIEEVEPAAVEQVPPTEALPDRAGMFTVWSTHGIGLAERLERKASGIESIEAGKM
jgi:hypothetical protein